MLMGFPSLPRGGWVAVAVGLRVAVCVGVTIGSGVSDGVGVGMGVSGTQALINRMSSKHPEKLRTIKIFDISLIPSIFISVPSMRGERTYFFAILQPGGFLLRSVYEDPV